ncbi:MAG: TetR/AcrR family transcriptional regulator [Pseudobdellovibrionaceae bacterium]
MSNSPNEKMNKTKIIVKAPTQERSRQTVATILNACSRLLISEGFYEMTTDRIAKEAGVSIGSLYQFFGNKESVVQAMIKNIFEEDKRILSEKMRALSHLPIEERVKALVEVMIEMARRNSELRAKLTTIVYYVMEPSYISDTLRFIQDAVRFNLPQVAGRDMDKVSYMFVNAFMGLINNMSIDQPEAIHNHDIAQEITQLFIKYLDLDFAPSQADAEKKSSMHGDFI